MIKTIIYRIYSALITLSVLYLLTGEIQLAGKLAIILEFIKTCQYYLFEKMWKLKEMRTKTVIVLGRGRSGTSLVAGLLSKLGVDMGYSRQATSNNPFGYFEDINITDILDKYVKEDLDQEQISNCPEFEKDFKEYVKRKKGLWGWKQPITVYLLPLIIKHAKNPYFIVCHRSEEAHAQSINKAFWGETKKIEWCIETIRHYYNILEKFFRVYGNHPRLDVNFEDFYTEPYLQIKAICRFLNIPFKPEVKEFINLHTNKYESKIRYSLRSNS